MEARDLRVSDAEREHVGELLQRAVGQGMLSLGEFTERMDTALAAKTRGELNAVLVDLPGMQIDPAYFAGQHPTSAPVPAAPVPPPATVPVAGPPTGYATGHPAQQPLVIRSRMSTITRKGRWNVPPTLFLDSRMGTSTLDFTEAVMQTQVVHLTVDDYCGSVTLVVPTEATVDLNGVDAVAGSVSNKVRTGPPYGPLHLVVRGRIRFGSITARHPYGTALRKMLGS
ncbi:DUF1707 domain-containing protein [Rhodococcus sp. TAF43]|uniref:DUF1707 SHOCT-like domain-containing protein n=1 Tax=unclassified Rhodococcus (in: high G+C Gram-positive bacteria) TaxID=192944 RepID=UPI000E0B242D|nr:MULTISPECIES: DUF1707 domain-containing protein [unclassified Rhodococcus (in: high G+C Gram-positive bacteria)]QKT13300.1 DUF1707 domain-containing protein [Rhodococcus sp. W8901]RDI18950.1 uncharacterized protein DUF1707 [Rhodococcus sp. AG1013]